MKSKIKPSYTEALVLKLKKKWKYLLSKEGNKIDYFELLYDVLRVYVIKNQPDHTVDGLAKYLLGTQAPPHPEESNALSCFAFQKLGLELRVNVTPRMTPPGYHCPVSIPAHPDTYKIMNLEQGMHLHQYVEKQRKLLRQSVKAACYENPQTQIELWPDVY